MIVEEGGIMETKIALFRSSGIRKTLHNNEWWFVVEDVVSALIDSKDPKPKASSAKDRVSVIFKEKMADAIRTHYGMVPTGVGMNRLSAYGIHHTSHSC
jgi:hypothetical protein